MAASRRLHYYGRASGNIVEIVFTDFYSAIVDITRINLRFADATGNYNGECTISSTVYNKGGSNISTLRILF